VLALTTENSDPFKKERGLPSLTAISLANDRITTRKQGFLLSALYIYSLLRVSTLTSPYMLDLSSKVPFVL
jgi:hypothetical protein